MSAGMLEETGTVVSAHPDGIWVEIRARSSCTSCSATSCTTSVVSKLFGMRRNRFFVTSGLQASPGQQVVIGIPDELLVRASMLAYLGPLVTMIGSAWIAGLAGYGEGAQGLAAIVGLGFGFVGLGSLTRSARFFRRFEPRVLRINHEQAGIDLSRIARS